VDAYRDDLAYIHDAGYGGLAESAAEVLLDLLRQSGVTGGLVIDLGCGSGILSARLAAAGYDVLGYDISESMIALARRRVPGGRFLAESFLAVELPACVAVAGVGECFNYLFDRNNTGRSLVRLFRRVHAALAPGGYFLFDVAEPGRVPVWGLQQVFRVEDDWAVLVTAREDRRRRLLTRHITTFRKVGALYRRDEEVHCQRLLPRQEVARQLRGAGFQVRILAAYGLRPFARGHVGFLARKPPAGLGRVSGSA
jgi:SAM-dependent methyltransferase